MCHSIYCRERATQLALKLSPELIKASCHQFKLCREKIGTCLAIVLCFTSVDKAWLLQLANDNAGDWNLNNEAENSFGLKALSISGQAGDKEKSNDNPPNSSTEGEEQLQQRQEELNNRSETFIQWILSCLKFGDASVYILPVIRLLPAVMYAVRK